MKAIINEGCIGCGLCASTCEEVFELNDDGFAVVSGKVTKDNIDDAHEAEENCPVNVIVIED
ncbi:MAG: ferredoxin [Spirochaetaceae bacterium]|nr:ferredoxin [Spirochaetaceae bacterium]